MSGGTTNTSTRVVLTGIEEMKRQLQSLADAVQNSVAHGSLLDAAKILRAEVQARAPVRSGNLKANIIIKRDDSKKGQAAYAVLVRKIKYSKKVRHNLNILRKAGYTIDVSDDAFYWRFVEFGHRIIRNKKVFGDVPAQPFFRPAIAAAKEKFIAAVGAGMQTRMDAAIRKAA
jgi:HK97 gp10 family phage protein